MAFEGVCRGRLIGCWPAVCVCCCRSRGSWRCCCYGCSCCSCCLRLRPSSSTVVCCGPLLDQHRHCSTAACRSKVQLVVLSSLLVLSLVFFLSCSAVTAASATLSTMSAVGGVYKQINKYLQQAKKLDKIEPVIAYYCQTTHDPPTCWPIDSSCRAFHLLSLTLPAVCVCCCCVSFRSLLCCALRNEDQTDESRCSGDYRAHQLVRTGTSSTTHLARLDQQSSLPSSTPLTLFWLIQLSPPSLCCSAQVHR